MVFLDWLEDQNSPYAEFFRYLYNQGKSGKENYNSTNFIVIQWLKYLVINHGLFLEVLPKYFSVEVPISLAILLYNSVGVFPVIVSCGLLSRGMGIV